MSIGRWMDKRKYSTYILNTIQPLKKEWKIAICSNMDGPRDYHTKWNKSKREWKISWFHLLYCGLLTMIQMNSSIKQKQTHRSRGQTYGCQGGEK